MEIATDVALLADLSQSRQFPDRKDVYEGYNLIMSNNPTREEVDTYFAAALVINTIIHREWTGLPKANHYRKKFLPYYQGGLIGIEIKCIAGNESLGVHVKF